MASKLPLSYFQQEDVLALSRDLLGKKLLTQIDGELTAGIIVETEAYRGPEDKASHAYGGRRTARTETMFAAGGVAYIYLCYGIHSLFNIVTNQQDIPHAILIRAIDPTDGIDIMLKRRKQTKVTPKLAGGPGTLSQALGLTREHDAVSLDSDLIWLEEGVIVHDHQVITGPRVGIDYAGEDAELPWRFLLKN